MFVLLLMFLISKRAIRYNLKQQEETECFDTIFRSTSQERQWVLKIIQM